MALPPGSEKYNMEHPLADVCRASTLPDTVPEQENIVSWVAGKIFQSELTFKKQTKTYQRDSPAEEIDLAN